MNIIELKDRGRTAWYRSDAITNIAKAAELLDRAIEADGDPTLATVERIGGRDLQPITHPEYMAALSELTNGSIRGFMAEIDLAGDSGCFTQVPSDTKMVTSVCGMISRITGIYQMSLEPGTRNLDTLAFTEGLVQHCDWARYNSLQERLGLQEQRQPLSQNLTMQ